MVPDKILPIDTYFCRITSKLAGTWSVTSSSASLVSKYKHLTLISDNVFHTQSFYFIFTNINLICMLFNVLLCEYLIFIIHFYFFILCFFPAFSLFCMFSSLLCSFSLLLFSFLIYRLLMKIRQPNSVTSLSRCLLLILGVLKMFKFCVISLLWNWNVFRNLCQEKFLPSNIAKMYFSAWT